MKISALASSYAALVELNSSSTSIDDFLKLLSQFGLARTTTAFVDAVAATPVNEAASAEPTLKQILPALQAIQSITRSVGSKANVVAIDAVVDLAMARPNAAIATLWSAPIKPTKVAKPRKPTEPVRQQVVDHYVSEISAQSLGSAELSAIFSKLANDKKNVRGVEMAAIATRIANETSSTTKRPEALRRIMQRHEVYLTSAAKSDALKGTSAT